MLTSPVATQLQLTLNAIQTLLTSMQAIQNKDIKSLELPVNSLAAHIIASNSDDELLQLLKKINIRTLAAETSYQDKTYNNNFLHWCVLADRPKCFHYFLSKGAESMLKKSNLYALTPLQLAAVTGKTTLFSSRFNNIPEFHESPADFSDDGKKYTVNINELHLAMVFHQEGLIKSIFDTFSRMEMPESKVIQETEMAHVGNCLHFLSYVSLTLSESESAEAIEKLKQTMALLLSQPIFKNQEILEMVLSETNSNYENLTPIAVAAKYGQKTWVDALKLIYIECGLEQCIEEAEQLLTTFAKDAKPSKHYSPSMWAKIPTTDTSNHAESSSAPSMNS